MIPNRVEFIAEQLRGASPGVDWVIGGIDRSIELAKILDRNDISDLWRLKLVPVRYTINHPPVWTETESSAGWSDAWTETVDSYAFDYEGQIIGFLGTPDRRENLPAFEKGEAGYRIAWSAEGHGNVGYVIRPNQSTGRLSIVPIWGSSSDAGDLRMAAIAFASFFAFTALPLVGVSVGNAIGSAVLPSAIATAYPGLATAIGNVALSAALNGGDVQSAVKNVVISTASGGAGDLAQIASDSALIGSLTAAATEAAIRGDSIGDSVAMAALRHGASNVGDFLDLTSDPIFTNGLTEWTPDFSFEWDGSEIHVEPAKLDYVIPLPDPIAFDVVQADSFSGDVNWDPINWDVFSSPVTSTPNGAPPVVPIATPPPNSPAWNPATIVQGVSSAALAALQLVKAYRSLDTPTIQTTARARTANGAVSVVGNNGLIQTRQANGAITAGKPPVGVPQATPIGKYIVNNGDGTYTVVAPTGASQTLSYGDSEKQIFPGVPNVALLAGAAIGVALLARRK